MSLFFLKLSFLTYFTSHYWAKKTLPERNFSFGKLFSFSGEQKDFEKKLTQWISKQPGIKIIEKKTDEIVLSQRPTLFSYGYFYHIQWTQKQNGLEVIFCVQPKLVSLPSDKKAIGDEFTKALELKNVS